MNEAMTRPTWSLISVTYNSADKIRAFWGDYAPDPRVEWIVVDNASSDDSVGVARALGATVLPLEKNLGFGGANNRGFELSQGDYVAFVNPDVTVDTADLPSLEAVLRAHPRALIAPQLLNSDGSLQPNGRGLPYLMNKVLNRTVPERLVGDYLRFAEPGELTEVEWVMGAVVAGTRERLDLLGPWDERFFVYYEDSDIGLRNSRLGGTTLLSGDTRWIHGWARETTAPSYQAWKREIPSMLKFYSRYPRLLSPRPLKHLWGQA